MGPKFQTPKPTMESANTFLFNLEFGTLFQNATVENKTKALRFIFDTCPTFDKTIAIDVAVKQCDLTPDTMDKIRSILESKKREAPSPTDAPPPSPKRAKTPLFSHMVAQIIDTEMDCGGDVDDILLRVKNRVSDITPRPTEKQMRKRILNKTYVKNMKEKGVGREYDELLMKVINSSAHRVGMFERAYGLIRQVYGKQRVLPKKSAIELRLRYLANQK